MNIPPAQRPATPFLKRRRASDWLRQHDPDHKKNAFLARKKRERDEEQARNNTALVGQYRRAMLRS